MQFKLVLSEHPVTTEVLRSGLFFVLFLKTETTPATSNSKEL